MNRFWLFILVFFSSALATHVITRPSEVFFKSDCNIGIEACELSGKDKSFKISFTPRPLRSNMKTVFKVETKNIKAKKVRLYLFGHDLNTERTFFDLHKDSNNSFSLIDLFPTCVEKSQKWKAHVQIIGEDIIVKSNLSFVVKQ